MVDVGSEQSPYKLVLNMIGVFGGATLLLSPFILKEFMKDYKQIQKLRTYQEKLAEIEKSPEQVLNPNLKKEGLGLVAGKLSSGLGNMNSEFPLFQRSWFFLPGLNGGYLWYSLSENVQHLWQSKPHVLEQQNITLQSEKGQALSVYPSQRTLLLNLPEQNKTVTEYKIYGSNLDNPNTEPSSCLGMKQTQYVTNYFPLTALLTSTNTFLPLQQILYRQFSHSLYQDDNVMVFGNLSFSSLSFQLTGPSSDQMPSLSRPLAIVHLPSLAQSAIQSAIGTLQNQFKWMRRSAEARLGMLLATWGLLVGVFYWQWGSQIYQVYQRFKEEKRRAAREKLKIQQIERFEGISNRKVLEIHMDGYQCGSILKKANGEEYQCPNICNIISINCNHGTYCHDCFSTKYKSLLDQKIKELNEENQKQISKKFKMSSMPSVDDIKDQAEVEIKMICPYKGCNQQINKWLYIYVMNDGSKQNN